MNETPQIPPGFLLSLGNGIIQALGYDGVLEVEDDLFSDEFYLTIVGNLVPENSFNIQPGETLEEKAQSLTQLVNFLSVVVEMELYHINAKAIIFNKDKESTKHLLELIYELISLLKQEQEQEEEVPEMEEGHQDMREVNQVENISHELGDVDINYNEDTSGLLDKAQNKSEERAKASEEANKERGIKDNIVQNNIHIPEEVHHSKENENSNGSYSENMRNNNSCPEIEFEPENNSQINYKENYSQNDLTRYEKVMAYIANQEEYLQQMNQGGEKEDGGERRNMNEYQNVMNYENEQHSNNEEVSKSINISHISEVSRSKENSEPHSNQKFLKMANSSKNYRNESENATLKITHEKNVTNSQYDSKNEVGHPHIDPILGDEYDRNRMSHSYSSYLKKEQTNQMNEDQSLRKSEREIIKEKGGNIARTGKEEVQINSSDQNHKKKNSNSINSSKADKNKTNSQRQNQSQNSSKGTNPNEEGRTLKKVQSQKQLINKEKPQHENEKEQKKSDVLGKNASHSKNMGSQEKSYSHSEISVSSVPEHSENNINQNNIAQKSKQTSEATENMIEEMPLNDENFKAEIIKEFRRLYGNKLDRVFLKSNLQNSHDTLEIILRNIRLARKKMMKIGDRIPEPDDLMTKEFMLKYQKELQYILNYYHNEEKKRNFFRNKAIGSISKNVQVMKKIQDIQTKNIENEIERRKKCREVKNNHNQIRFCNEIYSKALELEKKKYLEEIASQIEIRKSENDEKRKAMMEIEKYYKDKITILREILRREKMEREIEHRAKIQFLSKLEREKKGQFKKQIDEIFERFDEEDKKSDLLDNDSEQIEKILMNYYKK